MKFLSKTERLAHSQAGLIPDSIWSKFFADEFPDFLLPLMQADDTKLVSLLRSAPTDSLRDLHQKQFTWLVVALSHPNISHEGLVSIAKQLNLSKRDLFDSAVILGNFGFFSKQLTAYSFMERQRIMTIGPDASFRLAAQFGHMPIIEYLLTQLSLDQVQELLTTEEFNPFISAAVNGHLSIMERFIELLKPRGIMRFIGPLLRINQVQVMILADNYRAFHGAAEGGHLLALERLIELAPDKVQSMIESNSYWAFRAAARNGHLPIIERLMQLAPDKIETMLDIKYGAFSSAAAHGHIAVFERFIELAPNNVQSMVESNNYWAFRGAAGNGHLSVIDRLIQLAPDKVQNMIIASELIDSAPKEYSAFRRAAEGGHLLVLDRLMALAPDKIQNMIAADNYYAFRYAVQIKRLSVINFLLKYSTMFSHAEAHVREYGEQYIYPWIDTKLSDLRVRKTRSEVDDPHVVFDITDSEEAKVLFYVARNLIRRNDPALLDHLRFLLEIPAVKALAHTEVTRSMPNELVRLALSIGNQGAATLLLAIPAINALVIQNNYYRNEVRNGLDIAVLARDRESSMYALRTGEKKRLEEAIKLYQPMIKEAGVNHLMAGFRQTLEARYEANSAQLMREDGTELALPLTWLEFESLSLLPTEKQYALKAYYQNKDHTAWRYLSKPNPWMHEHASYVEVNPDNHAEKWSTFEEYQPLITMFYLAAIDEQTPPCDEFTLEGRLEHFIDELAHIGRAHNWDASRVIMDEEGHPVLDEEGEVILEEYDNLEGDKPSCYSGVKRRLFQSVLGHPLLRVLTKESIDAEIRDFVRQHFASLIHDKNREMLHQAWDGYIEKPNHDDATRLKILDIPLEKQTDFMQALDKKYRSQLTDDPAFIRQIENAFKLKNQHDAHALNFGYVGWTQLLESGREGPTASEQIPRASELGLFADSASGPSEQGAYQQRLNNVFI